MMMGDIFVQNEKRINKLYHPSDIEVFKKIIKDEFGNEKVVLGSPLTSQLKNPMAMRACINCESVEYFDNRRTIDEKQ
jgi:CRISPR-associated endonuclease Csn1